MKDRLTPCIHYLCKGECELKRDAGMHGYCQHCDKYKPRVRERHLNKKKKYIEKVRKNEDY